MLDDFMIRAFLAGLGVALVAAPLGCFVVWRRMAYFGDATAHAAILGVALALATSLPLYIGVLLVALAVAYGVSALQMRGGAVDTLLGVIAHGALAIGLVSVSLLGVAVDVEAYLFGEILAVTQMDVILIWSGAVLGTLVIGSQWSKLILITVNEDLAVASGVNVKLLKMFLTFALALTVALALKVIGALLIGAMLLIPAAAARQMSRTPEAMVIGAVVIGALSVLIGLAGSYHFGTPSGPTIVCAALSFFLLSQGIRRA
ncbi:MAG: metal ABC transporter permease [Halocynthiibacter sp.]